VCRNVYQLFTGDIELYYRYFHAFYNIPVPPPSLDHTGTRPDDLPSAPAVQYMEAVWTEESLQMVGSMLVRCVHTQGEVTAIRDGYMVTLGHVEGRPTAWTVWYLPQWAEVTSSYKVNRNRTLDARQDVLMVKDLKMSTRPMDATENQRLWTWEFELGATIAAAAIHPEDNLLVVEVAQWVNHAKATTDLGSGPLPGTLLLVTRFRRQLAAVTASTSSSSVPLAWQQTMKAARDKQCGQLLCPTDWRRARTST
jgi:hypothetical protein